MTPAYKKLIQSLEKKEFAPVYLIDGEEPYYLDLITQYFEEKILTPAERDFNLMVLYGKDTEWADVVNACRRFPMFAERQVVILKDAASLKSLAEVANYLEQPSPTTVFLIEHRFKKADGRSRLTKLVKDKGVHFTSDKLKDEQIPVWIEDYGREIGLRIDDSAAQLLAGYLGNDLQKIANEISKVRINAADATELTQDLIQKYIGISREYNLFQFPEALTEANKDKLYRMLVYFTTNPKNAPFPLVTASFYTHFSKLYLQHFTAGKSDKDIAAALGLRNAWAAKDYLKRPRYNLRQIEQCLLALSEYNNESLGINSNKDDASLLKELVGKMELILG